jgi:hypothetical protein
VLGDVLADADQRARLAVRVDHDLSARVEHAHFAVGPHDAVLERKRRAAHEGVAHFEVDRGAIVGVDALEEAA